MISIASIKRFPFIHLLMFCCLFSTSIGCKPISISQNTSSINTLITPQQFGAKADGRADDAFALQQAVDYCIENRKNLYITSGTYKTTKSIKITGELVLEGEMKNASYIWYDPTTNDALFIIDAAKKSKNL